MSFAPIAENYNSESFIEAQRNKQTSDSLSVITELAHRCTVRQATKATNDDRKACDRPCDSVTNSTQHYDRTAG